jgi:ribulose-phosphate 3-epimerase
MGRIEIAPSILSADFGNMRDEVGRLERYGADRVHIDVMDGHFVPNLTFGPDMIRAIRSATSLPFETHLMIDNPDMYLKSFAEAGSDTLIVHCEATRNLDKTLKAIRSLKKEAGVAINPETRIDGLLKSLRGADMLLVMGVHPGFGGQKLIGSSLYKIGKARDYAATNGHRLRIGIDGGINLRTGQEAIDHGANELIAGSAIFGSENVAYAIKAFKALKANGRRV